MWSVSTIITGLISFMVETAPTLGSIETSVHQKKKFAKQSLAYNANQKTFQKLFPELVTVHEELEQRRKELGLKSSSSDSSHSRKKKELVTKMDGLEDGMMQSIMAIGAGFVALLSIMFAMRFL